MIAETFAFDTLPVALTVYASSAPLSKAYALADGRIVKTPAAQMAAGTARTIEVPFAALADVFDSLGSDEATGYGLFEKPSVRIATAKTQRPPATFARTAEHCQYRPRPGVLMIDHDPRAGAEPMPVSELLSVLAGIVPGMADAAVLIRPSVSAGVRIAGTDSPPASGGYHIYMPVADASDIPRFGAALFRRLWMAGHGYIALASNGAALVRSCIDAAVFAGERPDFTGRPIVGEGLDWTPPVADYRHGGYLDTAALADLSDAETAAYTALVESAKTAAKPAGDAQFTAWAGERAASMRAAGVAEGAINAALRAMRPGSTADLHPAWPLHFTRLGIATVAEVMAAPARYDGEPLADPVEGPAYGLSTARFYANLPDGRPVVNSMAHGGSLYFLPEPRVTLSPSPVAAPALTAGLRVLGRIDARAVLCIATDEPSAAAIHEHAGLPVAIAGASARLWKAAHALRDANPRLRLLVCGDAPDGDKARAAAFSLVGGSYWCVPDFERPGADELTAAAIGLMKKPPVEGETVPAVFLKDAATSLRARDRRRIAEESPATFADLAGWDAGAERVAQQIKAAVGSIGVIRIRAGKLSSIVERAEKETLFAGAEYYERVGALVRPVHQDRARCADGVSVPAGALVLTPVTLPWLTCQFARSATWQKWSKDEGEWRPADPPAKYAETLMHLAGEWRAPVLTGIVECPTLRRDGSLITASGYDKQSGLYLNYTGEPVSVPDAPSRADALAALELLKEPYSEFPFAEPDVDLSVVIAGLLTAVVRRSLRTAPLFAFDAPAMGCGKGLIVNTIATIATGRAAPAISQGKDETEDEKRLGALLMQGVPLINIDNIERDLAGDLLCSALTETSIAVRILGKSEVPYMPANVAMFATGNNLAARGDMVRRMLVCRIDPACERPDGRTFTRNLNEWVPKNRARLLSAALTVLRAYVVAGKPEQDIAPYGSFEEWSGWVRSALVWLGMADPRLSRARLEADDEVSTSVSTILSQWREHLGAGGLTAAEVAMQATMPGREELLTALLAVAASKRDPEKVDSLRLGHWLKRHKGRVASGLRLEKAGEDTDKKIVYWRVVSPKTTTRTPPGSKFTGITGITGIDSSNAREKSITTESVGESTKCESGLEQYPLTPVIPVNPASPAPEPPASAPPKPARSPVASGLRLEKAGEDLHSKAVFWRVVTLNATTRKNPVSDSAGIAGIAGIDSSNAREKSITTQSEGESLKHEGGLKQPPQYPHHPQTPAGKPPASAPPKPADAVISHHTCGSCAHSVRAADSSIESWRTCAAGKHGGWPDAQTWCELWTAGPVTMPAANAPVSGEVTS